MPGPVGGLGPRGFLTDEEKKNKPKITKELLLRRRCKRLQFIVKSNSDQPLLVYGVALLYHKKRVKGSGRGVTQNS